MNDIILTNTGKGTLKKFMSVIAQQLNKINFTFAKFANEQEYLANITAQTIYMQMLLNDKFDNFNRRIIIENTRLRKKVYLFNFTNSPKDTNYLFNKSDSGNVNYTSMYYYNRTDVSRDYDFIVHVGSLYGTLATNTEFIGYINKFKFPDKKYIITS